MPTQNEAFAWHGGGDLRLRDVGIMIASLDDKMQWHLVGETHRSLTDASLRICRTEFNQPSSGKR